MKKLKVIIFAISLAIMLVLGACSNKVPIDTVTPMDDKPKLEAPLEKSTGKIYLYGEEHSIEKILEKELEIWGEYYHNDNMRHLFVEKPYYTAEFLNLWMKSDNDDILEEMYSDWEGTLSHSTFVMEFYKTIKEKYPETVFHGTDVGHQYATIGLRFLKYLQDNNMENTEQYLLTQEVISQGKTFYRREDYGYRENKMVENFIYHFDKLKDENVMGIYGYIHTEIGGMGFRTDSIPNMVTQLKKRYASDISSEDLTWILKDIEPIRVEILTINQKEYEASYFGKEYLGGQIGLVSREFWRIENAYEDFKDNWKNGNILPYDNYPMLIEEGQVFMIKYERTDHSTFTRYYRSEGRIYEGNPATEDFEM